MSKDNRRIWLVLHSRAEESDPVERKHARFFEGCESLPAPWGPGGRPYPPVPPFLGGSTAILSWTKYLGGIARRALISYRYRRLLRDDGLSDDLVTIVLAASRIDWDLLAKAVIPTYLRAFDAYLVEVFDESSFTESGGNSREAFNPRSEVRKLRIINYFDAELCRRTFKASPGSLLLLVTDKAAHAEIINDGLYLIPADPGSPPDLIDGACQACYEALIGTNPRTRLG